MPRLALYLYRFIAYFALFATVLYSLYAIRYVSGLVAAKQIDTGAVSSTMNGPLANLVRMVE